MAWKVHPNLVIGFSLSPRVGLSCTAPCASATSAVRVAERSCYSVRICLQHCCLESEFLQILDSNTWQLPHNAEDSCCTPNLKLSRLHQGDVLSVSCIVFELHSEWQSVLCLLPVPGSSCIIALCKENLDSVMTLVGSTLSTTFWPLTKPQIHYETIPTITRGILISRLSRLMHHRPIPSPSQICSTFLTVRRTFLA